MENTLKKESEKIVVFKGKGPKKTDMKFLSEVLSGGYLWAVLSFVFLILSGVVYASNIHAALVFFVFSSVIFVIFSGKNTSFGDVPAVTGLKKEKFYFVVMKIVITILLTVLGMIYIKQGKSFEGLVALIFAVLQVSLIIRPAVNSNPVKSINSDSVDDNSGGFNIKKAVVPVILVLSFAVSLYYFRKNMILPASAFFLLGAILFGFSGKKISAAEGKIPVYVDWAVVILLTLIAFGIRIYKIDQIPPGTSFDEGIGLPVAGQIMNGIKVPLFLSTVVYLVGTMYYSWLAVWAKFAGLTIESARIFSAFAGALNVVFIYMMAKEMFGRRTAVISSLVLAFFYYHVLYSRVAWLWVFTPLLATIAFWAYFKAEKTGRAEFYALSGVFVGLGLYFYNASKMVPFILFVYWCFLFFSNRYRRSLLSNFWMITMLVAAALIVFAPMMQYIYEFPKDYFLRIRGESAVGSWAQFFSPASIKFIVEQNMLVFQMFLTKSSWAGYFNYPLEPLLDRASGFLFLMGIGYSLYHIKKRQYVFILITLYFSLAAAIFSRCTGDPNSQRAVLSILPVAVIISIGAGAFWDIMLSIHGKIMKVAAPVFMAVLFIFSATWYYQIYFEKYPLNDSVRSEFFRIPTRMARYINDSIASGKKVFVSPFFRVQTSMVVYGSAETIDPGIPMINGFYIPGKDIVIMSESIYDEQAGFYGEYFKPVNAVREYDLYSDFSGKYMYRSPDFNKPRLYYVGIEIPAAVIEKAYSVKVTDSEKKESFIKNGEQIPVPSGEAVELRAMLVLPEYDSYSFNVTGLNNAVIYLNGRRAEGAIKSYKGMHELKITGISTGRVFELLWKRAAEPSYSVVGWEFMMSSDKLFGLVASYTVEGKQIYRQLEISPTHRYYYTYPRLNGAPKYDIKWTGKFLAEKTAEYSFDMEAEQNGNILLDGKNVFEITERVKKSRPLKLEKGWHNIEVNYSFTSNSIIFGRPSSLRIMYSLNGSVYSAVPYRLYKPK